MISSYVKKQLAVFSVLTLAAVLIIAFVYAHVPTALGFGQMTVTATFTNGAGIYTNANVTTRGVGIGEVTDVTLTKEGQVLVTMSIDDTAKIAADARAEIHSVSAVGEQYVDLVSDRAEGPYLEDEASIPVSRTSIPEPIAPVLDKTRELLASIPADGLHTFMDEGYKAFANLGPDLRTLVDASISLVDTADQNYPQTSQLIRDFGPLFDTQNVVADEVRAYFKDLDSITGALHSVDPDFRDAFYTLHAGLDRVTTTLEKNDDPLYTLSTNLRTTAKVLDTYNAGIEQVLVTYPVVMSWLQLFGAPEQGRGLHAGLQFNSFWQGCTTGFNGKALRNPEDISDKDAEPNTYCKVPHDDPRLVRGVRNNPCQEGNTSMRAATVDQCLGRKPAVDYPASEKGKALAPKLPVPGKGGDARLSSADPLSTLGGMGTKDTGKDDTWQSLLTGPVGK